MSKLCSDASEPDASSLAPPAGGVGGFESNVNPRGAADATTSAPIDAGQTTRQWRHFPEESTAPKGAPNVLIVMTDDVGFGASSTFGGPIPTPFLDALAANGLRYNQFHTTGMCSPSRAALLTGRNHHSVGAGTVAFIATDDAGYTSVIPDSAATIAEILRQNGYNTAWFGKNHNTPLWENTPIGPFDRWPNGLGFDYFYGFNMSMVNQFTPSLVENRNCIDAPRSPDYILDKDLADRALSWLRIQRTLAPEKPFMIYYAPGTAHAPHQAPKAWIDKFKGQFDQGWDEVRQETFNRQKVMGIIPSDALLTPRPDEVPAWDSLSPDEKKVAARLMEVYAAALSYFDDQFGRVIDELGVTGQLQNTLVIFVQGDNGASAGAFEGTRSELAAFGGIETGYKDMIDQLDELGGPHTWEDYPVGWACAMDTPFQWAKTIASHLGGIRNGLVISWPQRIRDVGAVRPQFHHLIDILPTILEAAGIDAPKMIKGVTQKPIEGVSMVYSFNQPAAASTRTSQYFEILGNRSFYKDGWMASTTPKRMPWLLIEDGNTADSYEWELYDLSTDYSQARDLAKVRPEKLAELRDEFMEVAERYNVLPLNDAYMGRVNPALRPSRTAGRTSFLYYPGATRYTDGAFPKLGKHWRVTAKIESPPQNPDGTLIVQGDHFGGWGLFVIDGKVTFIYRASDQKIDVFSSQATDRLHFGPHLISVVFDGRGYPSGANAVIEIDGRSVKHLKIDRLGYAGGDVYVGRLGQASLVDALSGEYRYGGTIDYVEITLAESSSTKAS